MAGEQAGEGLRRKNAAADAGRGCQGRGQKATAGPLLEHAGLITRRILRRRGRLLIHRLLLRCRAGVPTWRCLWRGRRSLRPAAEQPAEQAARRALLGCPRGLLRLLHGLLGLLQFPFQALDAVLGLGHRMLLHERGLRQAVARVRVLLEQGADQGVGVAIDRRQRRLNRGGDGTGGQARLRLRLCAADAGEELGDDVAFFVGHDGSPWVRCFDLKSDAKWPFRAETSMAE